MTEPDAGSTDLGRAASLISVLTGSCANNSRVRLERSSWQAVYVRCYVSSTAGSSDPLTNFLTRYASSGLASLDDEFVSYLTRLGEKQ